jgi:hypothetical protein
LNKNLGGTVRFWQIFVFWIKGFKLRFFKLKKFDMNVALKIQDDIFSFVRPITDERLLERIKMAIIRELDDNIETEAGLQEDVPDAFYVHIQRIMEGVRTGAMKTYSS